MKIKFIYITSIIILANLLLISGCENKSTNNLQENIKPSALVSGAPDSEMGDDKEPANTAGIPGFEAILEGYPSDILPMYNCIEVGNCTFIVRDDDSYVIGKDLYILNYQSEATLQEVSEYYKSIMTAIDPDYSELTFVDGSIGSRHVMVSLYDMGDGTISVGIDVGVDPADYVSENPYFVDRPDGLIRILDESVLTEQSFDKQYSQYTDEIVTRYSDVYVSEWTIEEIKAFYTENYQHENGFTEVADDYSTAYSWTNQEYECQVYITEGYDSSHRFYTIEIRKND